MDTATAAEPGVWDDLGAAALMLAEEGKHQAAALLLDVESFRYETDFERLYPWLGVPFYQLERFTDEIKDQIRGALREVVRSQDWTYSVEEVTVHRAPPQSTKGWREQVERQIQNPAPLNQASLAPLPERVPAADGFLFRSESERRLYRALKREQESRWARDEDSFTILVNTPVRIPDHTWEADFIVCFRGRVGGIETDGPHHRGRAANDRSRDRLMEDAGLHYVDRISVEAIEDEADATRFIRRFLNRLGGEGRR